MSGNVFVSPYNPVQQSGVRAKNPPDLVIADRAPSNSKDWAYFIGTQWLWVGHGVWGLIATSISPSSKSATWYPFGGGAVAVGSLTANDGTVVPPIAGTIIVAGTGVSTSGVSTTANNFWTTGNIGLGKLTVNATQAQYYTNRTPAAANYPVVATDNIIAATASNFTITLEAAPVVGRLLVIMDESGTATATPITIAGNGKTINGSANFSLNVNYGAVSLYYNGTAWFAYSSSDGLDPQQFVWAAPVGAGPVNMAINTGYVTTGAGNFQMNLPVATHIGDRVEVIVGGTGTITIHGSTGGAMGQMNIEGIVSGAGNNFESTVGPGNSVVFRSIATGNDQLWIADAVTGGWNAT